MDLDRIKDKWQKATLKSTTDRESIQHILDNRGLTALEKLIKYERLFLKLAFVWTIFIPFFWFLSDPIVAGVYFISMVVVLIWQQHKLKTLKGIDVQAMNIFEVSQQITTYRKYLIREFMVGMVWAVGFIALYLLFEIINQTTMGRDIAAGSTFAIVYISSIIVITFAATFILYYKIYWRNIKAVQQSIAEIKSFDTDN